MIVQYLVGELLLQISQFCYLIYNGKNNLKNVFTKGFNLFRSFPFYVYTYKGSYFDIYFQYYYVVLCHFRSHNNVSVNVFFIRLLNYCATLIGNSNN